MATIFVLNARIFIYLISQKTNNHFDKKIIVAQFRKIVFISFFSFLYYYTLFINTRFRLYLLCLRVLSNAISRIYVFVHFIRFNFSKGYRKYVCRNSIFFLLFIFVVFHDFFYQCTSSLPFYCILRISLNLMYSGF